MSEDKSETESGTEVAEEVAEEVDAPSRPRRSSTLRWVVAPVLAFAVLTALIIFTGKPEPDALMKDAAASFGDVSRGNFQFAFVIAPQGGGSSVSVELTGPFEIIKGKQLPVANINYTINSGGRTSNVNLLTTGDKAYTIIGGQAYALPDSATKDLRTATKDLSKNGGTGLSGIDLNINDWLIDPKVTPGGQVDGTATWRTEAKVNVVAAVQDLAGSLGTLGAVTGQSGTKLTKKQIKAIQEQIKDASVIVYVGQYDHILRKLDLSMNFKTAEGSTSETGSITGGKATLQVGISDPNRPVGVKPPKNPLPYSALQSLAAGESSQTGTTLDDGVGR